LNKEKEEKDMFEEDMLLVGERLRKDKERQLRNLITSAFQFLFFNY